jgi:hypothetical protein
LIYKPKNSIYSRSQIRIFPNNPQINLPKEVAISLIHYLSKEFPNKELHIELDSTMSFVDCGEEFEKVVCPYCGKEISMEFWQEAIDKASQTKFMDLTNAVACVKSTVFRFLIKNHSRNPNNPF